jgi:hypothetical protein
LTVILPHFAKVVFRLAVASALVMPAARLAGETAEDTGSDPSKRLQWLNSHLPPVAPRPPAPKVKFRANPVAPRSVETPPVESRPAQPPPAEAHPAKPVEGPSTRTSSGESRLAKATPPAPAKATPTRAIVVASPSAAKIRTAEARSTPPAKTTPAPTIAQIPRAETRTAKATPAAPAKPTPPAVVAAPSPAKVRSAEARPTPLSKPIAAPVVASLEPARSQPARAPLFGSARKAAENRYPWKTDIVTTIFWIGEPVGGHNFTPNFASSWDPHWTQAYGGFDTPDTSARRNFIPVKFVPRQNPFYVALPYNDVTHGTTKPEARLVIPWFKEAFEREGGSVCRDRWVAVRNRAGKVGYAQWSDCGPFRTDHWQYVFGNEKPKPNLNKGAGLDVSPALRDFLGLGSTDVTDWKFVDANEVPGGPWALYGDNNLLARRGARPAINTAKETSRPAASAASLRVSKL